MFERNNKGKKKGEKPWITVYVSVCAVIAVIQRRGSRYRMTASVTP